MTTRQSALNSLRNSRPVQIGLAVGLAYIILTWGLYQSWMGSLETFMAGVGTQIDRSDPAWIQRISEASGDAPSQPFMLRLLSYPIPGPATVENGGAMPFWSVLLQGIWLGIVAWAGFAQTRLKFIALSVVPFIVLLPISGNVIASLLLGLLGPVIVSAIWLPVTELTLRRLRKGNGP